MQQVTFADVSKVRYLIKSVLRLLMRHAYAKNFSAVLFSVFMYKY